MELTIADKKLLIAIARYSIEKRLGLESTPPEYEIESHPVLNSKCGVFVTLTISNQLRGCIGQISSTSPIYKTVEYTAGESAFSDPRFYPLTKTEYEQVQIEISILSEPFPMQSYDDIELGRHGLILQEGKKRGLLLPQVPIEHDMDKDEFLTAICRKTGVRPDLWKDRTLDIMLFTASVFCEEDLEEENELS